MNRSTNPSLFFAAFAVTLLSYGTASAGLMGQTVTADWLYPNASSVLETHDVMVGAGVELPAATIVNTDGNNIDLYDEYILFTFNRETIFSVPVVAQPTNGWDFSDTFGAIDEIVGYTIGATSAGIAGLTSGALSFTADSVYADFSGVTVAGMDDFIRLDIAFVPEPTTAVLFGLGLAGLALRRRLSA